VSHIDILISSLRKGNTSMALIGYARVSSLGQSLVVQLDKLEQGLNKPLVWLTLKQ
jgi:hypothetical protein